jgi:ATP-dependent DNA ligase
MSLPLALDYPPMEAQSALAIPEGEEWQYEPKWDGFRCLAFRDGADVELMSKSGQTLARYFPEIAAAVHAIKAKKFVLDGEIIVSGAGGVLSFDALLQRIHPAASRIKKLSVETPATLIVFDLLADDRGKSLVEKPLSARRKALEAFAAKYLGDTRSIALSPYTCELATAKKWFHSMGGGLDGIIAKRTDVPYQSDERTGMLKIKNLRTADCVVGGFRYATKGPYVGSLLLGLFNRAGLLDHVGFTSGIAVKDRIPMTQKLETAIQPPGFTGKAPGGPSRWTTERSAEWEPLAPKFVVEVQYDHFTGGRFRHGTRLLRWREDKKPEKCKLEQVEQESLSPLNLL